MLRTQIQLTEQQAAFLKARAAAEGISRAELIRKYIDFAQESTNILNNTRRIKQAASIAGQFNSGIKNLAENHDDYLTQLYGK